MEASSCEISVARPRHRDIVHVIRRGSAGRTFQTHRPSPARLGWTSQAHLRAHFMATRRVASFVRSSYKSLWPSSRRSSSDYRTYLRYLSINCDGILTFGLAWIEVEAVEAGGSTVEGAAILPATAIETTPTTSTISNHLLGQLSTTYMVSGSSAPSQVPINGGCERHSHHTAISMRNGMMSRDIWMSVSWVTLPIYHPLSRKTKSYSGISKRQFWKPLMGCKFNPSNILQCWT
jgi:hypothetical protein